MVHMTQNGPSLRSLLLATLTLATLAFASQPGPAAAQEPGRADPPPVLATPPMRSGRTLVVTGSGQPSGPAARRRLLLETGAGQVVNLNEPATNIFVADPKVAEVRPASANSLFVFGVAPGRTTIVGMRRLRPSR